VIQDPVSIPSAAKRPRPQLLARQETRLQPCFPHANPSTECTRGPKSRGANAAQKHNGRWWTPQGPYSRIRSKGGCRDGFEGGVDRFPTTRQGAIHELRDYEGLRYATGKKEDQVSAIPAALGMLLAFVAGLSFVFQQAVNAALRNEIGSPWWAGFVSYLGGTVAMLGVATLMRDPWPSANLIIKSNAISWSGGFFGAIYIAISILLLPELGTTTVIGFIVAGQLIGSILVDHFGLLGMAIHPFNPGRLVGAAMLVAGAILVRW
jgi:bacterial/archaeal transporter family-2 protein